MAETDVLRTFIMGTQIVDGQSCDVRTSWIIPARGREFMLFADYKLALRFAFIGVNSRLKGLPHLPASYLEGKM